MTKNAQMYIVTVIQHLDLISKLCGYYSYANSLNSICKLCCFTLPQTHQLYNIIKMLCSNQRDINILYDEWKAKYYDFVWIFRGIFRYNARIYAIWSQFLYIILLGKFRFRMYYENTRKPFQFNMFNSWLTLII